MKLEEFAECEVLDYTGSSDVMVSIYCLTYNHVEYIEEALKGFINQKTEYPYEIIVFDDASTDGTTDIIRDYESRYPNLIKAYIAHKNTYGTEQRRSLWPDFMNRVMKGRYFAICEGDDCWIDDNKLQMQCDYMEAHEECNMVLHNAYMLNYADNTKKTMLGNQKTRILTPYELILQPDGIFPTASMVFRREYWFLEGFFAKAGVSDWPMQLYAMSKGTVYFIERNMCVYRYMHSASWSTKNYNDYVKKLIHYSKIVKFLTEYNKYTNCIYSEYIELKLQTIYEDCFDENRDLYDLINCCNEGRSLTGEEYHSFFNELERYLKYQYKKIHSSDSIVDYIKGYKKIYVMGTGKYSEKFSQIIEENNISIDGYIVSDNQTKMDEFKGKKVYYLSDIIFDDTTCLIVAINRGRKIEIEAALKEKGIINYLAPFWENYEVV